MNHQTWKSKGLRLPDTIFLEKNINKSHVKPLKHQPEMNDNEKQLPSNIDGGLFAWEIQKIQFMRLSS